MRWAGWTAITGLWAFYVLALASFSIADPPSHVVAVHNQEIANLCGQVGAAVAYWSLHVMGLGAWILAIAAGALLVLRVAGRRRGRGRACRRARGTTTNAKRRSAR